MNGWLMHALPALCEVASSIYQSCSSKKFLSNSKYEALTQTHTTS